jgi:hypothetical protein
MDNSEELEPITAVVKALKPLNSLERHRTVEAAMLYLGETPFQKADRQGFQEPSKGNPGGEGYGAEASTWLKQNNVSADELDLVFHFGADGTFDIHDAPGKSRKEKTLNAYVLTGLGKYLTTGQREFDDALARGFCHTIGCYDNANHATYLKDKGPEFTGDKSKGYTLTNPGMKKGRMLVKAMAGASR